MRSFPALFDGRSHSLSLVRTLQEWLFTSAHFMLPSAAYTTRDAKCRLDGEISWCSGPGRTFRKFQAHLCWAISRIVPALYGPFGLAADCLVAFCHRRVHPSRNDFVAVLSRPLL